MNAIKPLCRCDARPQDLTMSRAYLDDLLKLENNKAKIEILDEVIDALNAKKQLWFSQSLVAGSATFWQNKVKTTDQLINEIEEIKCQIQ